MGGKEVFNTLPPEIRAMALVGHYLQSFAMMESAVNSAISKALKLDPVQGIIVCKNISFRDKIHILRTLLSISPVTSAVIKTHDEMLNEVGRYSADRNMVAHELFGAHPAKGGVEFLVAKAKGKLRMPETFWTVDEVEEKSDKLLSARDKLMRLATLFGQMDVIKALIDRQAKDGATITGLLQLGALHPEEFQPQLSPDSSSQETNPSQGPQTHQEPQG